MKGKVFNQFDKQFFIELDLLEARKATILAQKLATNEAKPQGLVNLIEHLGYIQIDSISVVQRAHHHTLWNRVKHYETYQLDKLLADKKIFEYWSHAAAYLPMKDYSFSLPRKHAIAEGEKHWFNKNHKLTAHVLNRIKDEGPLQAKDFEHKRITQSGWWDWKPAKKALEQLFMEGQLMVLKRQGFSKVYDLTERVLPSDVSTERPTDQQYYQHLIIQYLRANAFAKIQQISYLRKGLKKPIQQQCDVMLTNNQLIKIKIGNQHYYALPNILDLLKQKTNLTSVKILSPFDNLVIQRKRLKEIFGFDYQIECYVPADKRLYGYFSLPLLWGVNFAGRMDVKIERKTGLLNILNLVIETEKIEDFLVALKPSLNEFGIFNGAQKSTVLRISKTLGKFSQATQKQWIKQLLID